MPDRARAKGPRAALTPGARGRSEAALTIVGGAVVLVVLLAALIVPYLTEHSRIATEVPQPAPLVAASLVEFLPGQSACANEIGLLPGAQVAQLHIGTFGKAAAPLRFTLSAPGYHESVAVPPTYVDNGLLEVPFTGPGRALQGEVCITNDGTGPVALYASSDRTKSRSLTTNAGHDVTANFELAFYKRQPQSLLEQTGSILRRLRLFHAHLGLPELWLLALLFVFGVPLASLAVLAAAARERPRGPRAGAN